MSETPLPISSCRSESEQPVPAVAKSGIVSRSSSKRILYKCKTVDEYDGSQGWCMVGLVFLTNFLVLGFFKSHGMLTKILNKEFNSTMHVYILMRIIFSLNCAAGPLACYLTRLYSARSIALVGTSMVSFGLILSWFAESLTFLYFSLGVLTGAGCGLTYPTGVILVGKYFVGTKRAGLANALIVSGSPIGGMIMPGVISALTEIYSSRGAFLIVGGLMLHSILFVRSFTAPPKGIPRDNMSSTQDTIQTSSETDEFKELVEKICDGNPPSKGNEIEVQNVEHCDSIDGSGESPKASHSIIILKIYERDTGDSDCNKFMSGLSIDVRYRPNASHGAPTMLPDLVGSGTKSVFLSGTGQKINAKGSPIVPSELESKESNVFLRPFGNICDKCKDKSRLVTSDGGLECYRKCEGECSGNKLSPAFHRKEVVAGMLEVDRNLNLKRIPGLASTARAGSRPYIMSLDHSCVILCSKANLHEKVVKDITLNNNLSTVSNFPVKGGDEASSGNIPETSDMGNENGFTKRIKRWVLNSPLRKPTYVFLLLSNNASAISTTNILLMVSQLVEETGDNYNKTSFLYVLISVADLSGRLFGAFLSDRNIISPSVIYAVGLIFAGASGSVLAAMPTYNLLCSVALAFGLFTGCHTGIYGFLLTDIVGLENIHFGYGISMFLNGTFQFIAILISGKLVSSHKDGFLWLSPLLGCILVCGGLIWTFALLICPRDDEDVSTKKRKDSQYYLDDHGKSKPSKDKVTSSSSSSS